jgi:CDP-glycerol glycerophosphotransferase (TagB/SpsB family)
MFITLYPLIKDKRIWLFADKPDFSDDNANHLFRYAINQEDNIKKYFVIRKDSHDYDRLNKTYDNVVAFNSVKHKLLYLFAEKYISSYINEEYNPFHHVNKPLYKGLLNVQRVFLQHGVTKDNLSKFVNKYRKNLYLLVTVSEMESDSFKEEGYNFNDDVIQCLGFPRYDSLSSEKHTRQILFMPTWREQIKSEKDFTSSNYYKMINNVINNRKLHEILKENDYSLVFKPHPELSPFINLISSEFTKISVHDSYQDLFKNSSLLITDYSSVFFDFGYLKKPILYYHENDDYHYEKGYFNYEKMGFGEIVNSKTELEEIVLEYINKDCKMKNKYIERVYNFFKYSDRNNCKRNYEWLKNH